MTKRRIALVGTASSRIHVPVNDPSWEIWGVSARDEKITRADKWFELHRLDETEWAHNWRKEIRKWSEEVELVMLYPEPLGPNVTQYPHERIVKRFGTYFMQSTFSWMMALAIDEMRPSEKMAQWHSRVGCDEIGIWGVDMEYGTEYKEQRVGFRHFIDLARALGIQVTRIATSGLAYEPVPYPLIEDDPLLQKVGLRIAQTRGALQNADDLRLKTQSLLAQNEAVFQEIKRFKSADYDPDKRLGELVKEQAGLMKESKRWSKELVACEASLAEQEWLKDYLRP